MARKRPHFRRDVFVGCRSELENPRVQEQDSQGRVLRPDGEAYVVLLASIVSV